MSYLSRETTTYLEYNHKLVISYIEIRHDILLQCHGIYIGVKKFNYEFENDILRNYSEEN